jgi:pilus assembly protein CpaF
MPEREASELFEHPLLKRALCDLQTKFLAEGAEAHGLRVLNEVAVELSVRFWAEHDVANPVARLLFRKLVWAVYAHIREMGPLTHAMGDSTVTEIMVVSHDEIFVERFGSIERSEAAFSSPEALRSLVERAVSRAGRRIDESSPTCDFRWHDGSRVHAAIPPVALRGPTLTIRRFSERMFTPSEFVCNGTLTHEMLTFLRDAVRARRNILISGGTGTGKTTLLNLIAQFVSERERIITIEDTAELRIPHNHVVRLEARPSNAEGVGEISLRELVRNALRMRPDRIIVGECRGPEALDMLQAMNTGHEGSLGTIHANSPEDALRRLETLVMFAASELPLKAVREQVASGIHCVVQMEKREGCRRVSAIHRVLPLSHGNYATELLYGKDGLAC